MPPFRIQTSPLVSEISGRGPFSQQNAVDGKADIRRPHLVHSRRFTGNLRRYGQTVDPAGGGDKAGNRIFHIASSKPENVRRETGRMGKIPHIVQLSDQPVLRCHAAGGPDLAFRKLSHLQGNLPGVLFHVLRAEIDEDSVRRHRASFHVAVSRAFRTHLQNAAFLQLFHVAGQCSCGDVQPPRQFVHAHVRLFQEYFYDCDADIRTQRLEQRGALLRRFDMDHFLLLFPCYHFS